MKKIMLLIILSLLSCNIIKAGENQSNIFLKNNNQYAIAVFDTIPSDFPTPTIDSITTPTPGTILISNTEISFTSGGIITNGKYGSYCMMLDSSGTPLSYFKAPLGAADYKMNRNGQLSYASSIDARYVLELEVIHYIVDRYGHIIDSIQCGNGYIADFHEFEILPNGHYLLMAWEEKMMDLSTIFPGASPSTRIIGTVFQEIDAQKHVVFQWRSLDHLPLSDLAKYALQANTFDQGRGNSGFADFDGNYIFSFPSTNEIIKVNRMTGDIIWRLGGEHNQFTFIGENEKNAPTYFRWQHHVRRIDNPKLPGYGNLTLFDNGLGKTVPFSRVVEYKLDEAKKTCELVWDYYHTPNILCSFGGSCQRLPNGNTFIGWGLITAGTARTATEVTPDKKVLFDCSIPKELISYRSYKVDTNMCSSTAKFDVIIALVPNIYPSDKKDSTGIRLTFQKIENLFFNYNEFHIFRYDCPPVNCDFDGKAPLVYPGRHELITWGVKSFKAEMVFKTKDLPNVLNPEKAIVYQRDSIGYGKFSPMETTYDADTKELSITTTRTGEYIIGSPFETHTQIKPNLYLPVDKSNVDISNPVSLRWALLGYSKTSDLQVATDSEFTNIVIDKKDTYSSIFDTTGYIKNQTYYWRTKSRSEDGESEWSDIWSFTPKDPFMTMITPNGGDILFKDTTKWLIKWDRNTFDSIQVKLYRNGTFVYLIADSFYTSTNAISWIIPKTIAYDSTYKIRVVSIYDSNYYAESEHVFTISPIIGVEDIVENNGLKIANYPNPIETSTNFDFTIPADAVFRLRVFDINGIEITKVFEKNIQKGNYSVKWDSSMLPAGVYIYRLESGTLSVTNKFIKY